MIEWYPFWQNTKCIKSMYNLLEFIKKLYIYMNNSGDIELKNQN